MTTINPEDFKDPEELQKAFLAALETDGVVEMDLSQDGEVVKVQLLKTPNGELVFTAVTDQRDFLESIEDFAAKTPGSNIIYKISADPS